MTGLTPTQVNLFHVFVVGILAIYLGLYGTKSNKFVLQSLPFIAILGGLYHVYRLYMRWSVFGVSFSVPNLINLFHIIFVFPILFNIGMNKGAMNPQLQQALPWIGAGIIGYHLWRYYQRVQSPIGQLYQAVQGQM